MTVTTADAIVATLISHGTDVVFGLPGVGQLAYNAIGELDIPMITGTVLVAAVFMVVMNFIVDVLYTFIDPRVRLSRH